MAGARVWSADDRTGGPIDEVFTDLRREFPDLVIERLVGTYLADDDNVFWLCIGPPQSLRGKESVQVDTKPGGRPPFLLEGERHVGEHVEMRDASDARPVLMEWLRRRSAGR